MLGRILSAAGNLLDLPGSSVRDALALRNPFDQYLTPFGDQNRTSGRELLRHHGLAGSEDTWGNWAGGMAAETLLDPTNLVGAGFLANAVKKLSKVKAVNRGIDAANTLSKSQRAMGFMPEEVAQLTKIVDPATGLPQKTYHGTPRVFEQYDPKFDSGNNLYGKGYYTSDSPHVTGGDGGYHQKGYQDLVSTEARRHDEKFDRYRLMLREIQKHNDTKLYDTDPSDVATTTSLLQKAGRIKDARSKVRRLSDDAMESAVYDAGVAPNVRMQYIDSRKPFDMDAGYSINDLPNTPVLRDMENVVRGGLPNNIARLEAQIKFTKADIADAMAIASKKAGNRPGGGLAPRGRMKDLADLERELAHAQKMKEAADAGLPMPFPGETIYDRVGAGDFHREVLQPHGFDAIQHTGGLGRGGGNPHQVTIAFDPKQIYKPYIAKAMQQQQPLPSGPLPPGLAMLLHQFLARQHGDQQ